MISQINNRKKFLFSTDDNSVPTEAWEGDAFVPIHQKIAKPTPI